MLEVFLIELCPWGRLFSPKIECSSEAQDGFLASRFWLTLFHSFRKALSYDLTETGSMMHRVVAGLLQKGFGEHDGGFSQICHIYIIPYLWIASSSGPLLNHEDYRLIPIIMPVILLRKV